MSIKKAAKKEQASKKAIQERKRKRNKLEDGSPKASAAAASSPSKFSVQVALNKLPLFGYRKCTSRARATKHVIASRATEAGRVEWRLRPERKRNVR